AAPRGERFAPFRPPGPQAPRFPPRGHPPAVGQHLIADRRALDDQRGHGLWCFDYFTGSTANRSGSAITALYRPSGSWIVLLIWPSFGMNDIGQYISDRRRPCAV